MRYLYPSRADAISVAAKAKTKTTTTVTASLALRRPRPRPRRRRRVGNPCGWWALWLAVPVVSKTSALVPFGRTRISQNAHQPPFAIATPGAGSSALWAKKRKKPRAKTSGGGGGGGGFGSGATKAPAKAATTSIRPVGADKDSLEAQWDAFAAITDLEIKPTGNPEDDDYFHFEVADVFVRSGGGGGSNDDDKASKTGWFRIGKVCASEKATIEAALTLQRGLVFWTAVHMRRELMALGRASATSLELGSVRPAIVYMGSETDGPLGEDEAAEHPQVFDTKAPPEVLRKVSENHADSVCFGFRPDWNPPGFTYKRRESAALTKPAGGGIRPEDALGGDGGDE